MSFLLQQVGVHRICRLAGSWDCAVKFVLHSRNV